MGDLKIGDIQPSPLKYNKVNEKGTSNFSKMVKDAVANVNKLEADANKSIADLLQGKGNISETMIDLQKVDLSMRYFMVIRNKALQAYKEISHMQF